MSAREIDQEEAFRKIEREQAVRTAAKAAKASEIVDTLFRGTAEDLAKLGRAIRQAEEEQAAHARNAEANFRLRRQFSRRATRYQTKLDNVRAELKAWKEIEAELTKARDAVAALLAAPAAGADQNKKFRAARILGEKRFMDRRGAEKFAEAVAEALALVGTGWGKWANVPQILFDAAAAHGHDGKALRPRAALLEFERELVAALEDTDRERASAGVA